MNYPHAFSAGTTDSRAFSLLPDIPISEEEGFTMQWSKLQGQPGVGVWTPSTASLGDGVLVACSLQLLDLNLKTDM